MIPALSMLVAATLVARVAFGHAFGIDWSHLVLGATLGLASVGLTHRSLAVAVLSRGAAWLVFAPTAVASVLLSWAGRHVPSEIASIALLGALALFSSRAALTSPEARATFAPLAFRRWLLAGSVATAAAAVASGFIASQVARHDVPAALELALLSGAYVASSVAVVRMRAWGVLLGGLTSMTLLAWGLVAHGGHALPLFAMAAAPPLLMLVLPVAIARFWPSPARRDASLSTSSSPRARIAAPREAALRAIEPRVDEEAEREAEPSAVSAARTTA